MRSPPASPASAACLLALLVFAAPTRAEEPPPLCPAMVKSRGFPAGEKLRFRLDLYGADMGAMEIALEAPPREERGKVEVIARARARTSAFVTTNAGPYASFVTSRIGPGLAAVSSREEVDENGVHWMHELALPPRQGKLAITASKDGEPQPLTLAATPSARDMLSTLYALRAVPLEAGTPLCFEVYAGRHMWKTTGVVGPRETLETPLGKIAAVRLDLTSVRIDDPRVVRGSHFWISDDARRLPVSGVAEVRGKVLRLQLEAASGRGWSLGRSK